MTNSEIFKRLIKTKVNKYFKRLVFALILSVIVALSTAATAWLLDPAIKKIFLDKDLTMLYLIPIAIVVAFSAKGISLFLARATTIKVGLDISRDLQQEMAETILKSDVHTIEDKHSAKFISNFIFDTQLMRELVSTALLNMMKDTLTLTFLICLMFYQNWRLAIFAILMIPCAAIISRSLGKRMGKAAREAQEHSGNLARFLSEILKASKVIKIYQKENFEYGRAKKFIYGLIEKLKKMTIIQIRATPIMEILTGFIIAGFIYYSGYLVMEGKIGINNFFSFLAAMMLAYQPVRSLATLNMSVNQGLSAAIRILPIIDIKNQIVDKKDSIDLNLSKCEIKFIDCSFKYNKSENLILKNLNMEISGGKMTALVGHSGAGKSSILNLIPRFYDCNSGDITIDGKSIYSVKLKKLRNNISIVTQDTTLFDDTIKNNILYANINATDVDIKEASKKSFADEFIKNLPNKYDTLIGENGVRLSGGEKQRLSIARAMLKKTPIILLDEATSSLDAETENKIQEAISLLTKNKTTIVIAHRLSTILNSNKIFVINKGEVSDEGTHEQLLQKSSIYKNFYEKQIRKG